MILAPILAAALAAAAPATCHPTDEQRENANWLRRNCRVLTRADERVARAEDILARLAALKRLGPSFTLLVIDGLRGPQAYVTSRRVIVLSRVALELCHARLERLAAESNVAFVLAHEVAHWAHADPLMARLGEASIDVFEFNVRGHEEREVRADATALVDIVRGGFEPAVVLRGELLRRWATADGASEWYRQRRNSLRVQARRVKATLPLFDAGVAFLLAGRYEAAAALLETLEDETHYDGREVLADIGAAHLQLAFEALAACDPRAARRFALPGMVDLHTDLERLRGGPPPGRCREHETFREALETALGRLRRAVDADAQYAPGRLGLATALLLKGNYGEARGVCDPAADAGGGERDRWACANARAVAEYLLGEELPSADVQHQALARLRALAEQAPLDVAVAFNVARAASEQEPGDAARDAWRRVLALDPPRPLAAEARRMLAVRQGPGERTLEVHARPGTEPVPGGAPCLSAGPPTLPLPLGRLVGQPDVAPEPSLEFGLGQLRVYRGPAKAGGAAWVAYAIKHPMEAPAVVLVTEELQPPLALGVLREQLGPPEADIPLADGRHVLRYDGCAFTADGERAVQRLLFQPDN